MRIRTFVAMSALLLVSTAAWAQDVTPGATVGRLDFGARGTSTTGDAARYERYRDLTDGLVLETFRFDRQHGDWLLRFGTDHLGRTDQRLTAVANRQGKFRVNFMWDQIPMLLSRTTQTFFQGDVLNNGGVLTIDDAIQAQGQASSANIPLLFVPGNTQGFELRTDRHIAESGFQYLATSDLTVNGLFRNTIREGAIPYGGSFGHGSLVETVAPTNHQLREVDANAEWARGNYLFRAGYTGSWFENDVRSLTFDTPYRAVDTSSASSRGRASLPPTNSFVGANALASVRLPGRSRATAYFSTGLLKDAGDQILPQTVRTGATGINPLPRDLVEGQARTFSTNASFTSRPTTAWDFAVRYRSYRYDNQTPEFESFQRVAYDNAVSNLASPMVTEPFSLVRRSFDAPG